MRSRSCAPFLAVASWLVTGCQPDSTAPVFSDDFLFGVATAGFQNDPGCPTVPVAECVDQHSDWYHYVTEPALLASERTYLSGDALSDGPGSYELFERDYTLVKDTLHGNAVRLSLEWSRLFPRPTDDLLPTDSDGLRARADATAVAHYHRVFAALRARGLRPLVTLHHYTLPDWIHDALGCFTDLAHCSPRGWLDRERTVRELSKYAAFCGREFGAEVDLWATLNEPFAVVLPGFIAPGPDRSNPPAAAFAFDEARAALWAMVAAHARMYEALKAADQADADGDGGTATVGLVYNIVPAEPRDAQSPRDVRGAQNLFYLYNEVFLNAVMTGEVDLLLDGTRGKYDASLGGRLDFIGINYYTRAIVDGTDAPFFAALSPLTTFNPLSSTLYTETPQGLYDMVRWVNARGYPAMITENGSADPSDSDVSPRYLATHVGWLEQAVRDGARVNGYFYWTLVDNYEWNHGMNVKMGLYAVDPNDPQKTRRARRAVPIYGQIAQAGQIPKELADKYKEPRDQHSSDGKKTPTSPSGITRSAFP